MKKSKTAILALEDGRVFRGRSVGASGAAEGEVVFNTSMTGYGEILTDPSYAGQIVTLTTAHVGNYGVHPDDLEDGRPRAEAILMRSFTDRPVSWRADTSLSALFREHGIVAVDELDTRALTRHIRTAGALRGVLSTSEKDSDRLVARAREIPPMKGLDLASRAGTRSAYQWTEGSPDGFLPAAGERAAGGGPRIAVLDFGVKRNTLRRLVDLGCRVTVLPAGSDARAVLDSSPDGVLVSNGPGDPATLEVAAATTRDLLGRVPVFGICLGHQILGRALGGETLKLPFGHHAGNHPVIDTRTGRVRITAQNHGFAIDADTLPTEVEVTEVSGNDGTCEGLRHRELPAFSVQYHPEAGPGPHDGDAHFAAFLEMIEGR